MPKFVTLLETKTLPIALCKHCSGRLLLAEDVVATILQTKTTYFKKEPHFFIDQPRTYRIFMLRCIKSIFFNWSGN